MATRLGLTVIRANSTYGSDISQLVSQVILSGRKGSATRSLDITLLDNEESGESRLNIDLLKGYRCIFTWDGKELFRGVIFKKTNASGNKTTYKAYDMGIYLSNNKESFIYENCTLSQIFSDIAYKFGLRCSEIYQTSYIIPTIAKTKTTSWDILSKAMKSQYEGTGNRYYIDSARDYLRLRRRIDNVIQWVLDSKENILSFTRSVSIEKTRTRYKLFSNEDTVTAWTIYRDLENALGIMQEVETTKDTLSEAQAIERTKVKMRQLAQKEETIQGEFLGNSEVISGVAVFVVIPLLGLSQTYYVDSDTHTFTDNYHKMSLTLNKISDSEFR